jgi:N-acetylneuraminic acid mutarotase
MRFLPSFVLALWMTCPALASDPKSPYPAMPEAFSSFGAAVADGHVYVYGGHIAKTHSYSTEAVTGKFRRLDLKNPSAAWEELPSGPKIQGLALVAHGGKIYRIGGMEPRNKAGDKADNHSLASVAVFDPKTMAWAPFVDMPAGRSSHDAVVVGDTLVVVGGWNMGGASKSGAFHDSALLVDLSSAKPVWKAVPQPFKRRALNVAAVEGKVYAVGGMNSENEIEKRVDAFDVKSQTWSNVAELPGPNRNGFTPAACAQAGKVIASPADGKVYQLSDAKDAWVEFAQLDAKRLVHRMVPVGNERVLILGGASSMGNLSTVELIGLPGTKR